MFIAESFQPYGHRRLWAWKGKETTFTLRALPIGGYVAMAGEEGSEFEGVPHERTIKGVSHWKQIIIMLAGVIMNFVLAWLIFASIILINGSYNIAPKAVVGGRGRRIAGGSRGLCRGRCDHQGRVRRRNHRQAVQLL